jgi:hypothetical protein
MHGLGAMYEMGDTAKAIESYLVSLKYAIQIFAKTIMEKEIRFQTLD